MRRRYPIALPDRRLFSLYYPKIRSSISVCLDATEFINIYRIVVKKIRGNRMGKRLLEELAGHISATRSMLPASDAKLGMGMLSFTVDQEIFVMVPEQLGKDKYEVRDNAARLLQKENADTFVIGGFLASGVRTENLSQDYGGSLHDHPDAFEVMLS